MVKSVHDSSVSFRDLNIRVPSNSFWNKYYAIQYGGRIFSVNDVRNGEARSIQNLLFNKFGRFTIVCSICKLHLIFSVSTNIVQCTVATVYSKIE